MENLSAIKSTLKTGQESIIDKGKPTNFNLLDFWRWSVSDLISNVTRGRFAEFIVGTAIGLKFKQPRDEWATYDLITDDGIKIEVKSAAYIQSWNQKKYSVISFSIKPAKYWDSETNMHKGEPQRHADVYLFCLLKHKDQKTIDPLNMAQWEFYLLPTSELNEYKRSQSSITLTSLQKLTDAISYSQLKESIDSLKK